MKAFILLILTTFLLSAKAQDTETNVPLAAPSPTPVPTPGGSGFEIDTDPILRTLSPTIDVNAITGRGIPTKNPTPPPTDAPTTSDMGEDINLPELPGVEYDPELGQRGPETDTPTYSPVVETFTPTYSPVAGTAFQERAAPQPDGASDMRIGSSAVFCMIVGFVVLIGFQ